MSENVLERYQLFIFDADDTLRRTTVPGKPCPHHPDEWELMPGVRETLSRIPWGHACSPHLGLASNQDQIAYGNLTIEMARRLLRDLAIAATGASPPEAALQLCPHALDVPCDCRKPAPAMLLRIMEHYGLPPDATVFVGNHEVDRLAAERAGVAFVWGEILFGEPDRCPGNHPR
jgi:D-glycero-D-manno-heptose 1,7-bisphosphate phosphatase